MAENDPEKEPIKTDSDDDDAISEKQKYRENSSPTAGCVILATIVTVFGGLVLLYTLVGFYQNRKHHEFTDESAREIPVYQPSPAEVEEANRKLFNLLAAASGNTNIREKLTVTDLNTLIATKDKAQGYRGNTRVKKITPEGMEVEMSQPVRQFGIGKPNRYLNATFVFLPEKRARTVAFRVIDIKKEDREVDFPKAYIESYAALDFYRLDPEDDAMGPVMKKIERVYLEEDHLIIETRIELNN